MIKYNATRKSVYTEISVEMILYLFDEVETGHVIQIHMFTTIPSAIESHRALM